MEFAEEHERWLKRHLRNRTGERHDRLRRGHGHGEKLFLKKVWWPLFGHFTDLHPEYEIADWRGMKFFVDFMYIVRDVRIAIEIKGYGPHVQQTDRTRYRNELNRELFLQSLGCHVISIPYDELEGNHELIKMFVRMILSRYTADTQLETSVSRIGQELIRFARLSGGRIRPANAAMACGITRQTAVKHMKQLTEKGLLRAMPTGKSGRITSYEYIGPKPGE